MKRRRQDDSRERTWRYGLYAARLLGAMPAVLARVTPALRERRHDGACGRVPTMLRLRRFAFAALLYQY